MIEKLKQLDSMNYWPLSEVRDKLNEVIEAVNEWEQGMLLKDESWKNKYLGTVNTPKQEQPEWKVGDIVYYVKFNQSGSSIGEFWIETQQWADVYNHTVLTNAFKTRDEADKMHKKAWDLLKGGCGE